MIKKQILTLGVSAIVSLFISLSASADQHRGFFAGGSYIYTSMDTASFEGNLGNRDSIELPSLELSGGYKYNGWLGIDVRYGIGLSGRSLAAVDDAAVEEVEYEIDGYHAIYYRPEITNNEARLYFLFGIASADILATNKDVNGGTVSKSKVSESGTSYGFGMGWFLQKRMNFNLEYRALVDQDDVEVDLVSIGLDYRF